MPKTPGEQEPTLERTQSEATDAHTEAADIGADRLADIQSEVASAHTEAVSANVAATEAVRVRKSDDVDRLEAIQKVAEMAHKDDIDRLEAIRQVAEKAHKDDIDRLKAIQEVALAAHEDARLVKEDLDESNLVRDRATRILIVVGILFVLVLSSLVGMTFYVASIASSNHALSDRIIDCITPGGVCYQQAFGKDRVVREDIDAQLKANADKLDQILSKLPK